MKKEKTMQANNKTRKKIGIIGGGYMAGIYAINAHEMQIEVHCFSPSNGVVNASLFDYVHDVDILDFTSLLSACEQAHVDGVVSTTELTIAPTAYVAKMMHLNGLDYETSKLITNKFRNRALVAKLKNVSNPLYYLIKNKNELANININYPIIVKPTGKGGKRGISVVNSQIDLSQAIEYAIKEGNGDDILLEEYIDGGMECSVESLTYNNETYVIQITEKITSGAPHCVELAHHQPANISLEMKNRIISSISDILKAVGVNNGPCHTEIKIKNDKIYLIEINARPGGDHIAYPLTQLSTGYPYIKGSLNIALDEFCPVDYSKFINKFSGVMFVTKQTEYLLPIFNNCEKYPWFYKKNFVSNDLMSIVHNNGFNLNYFIYCYTDRPNFGGK